MKLSNFHEDDKVLLLGEGNFSFAVALAKHNLTITITATCYETSSILHDSTKENVDFLRDNGQYRDAKLDYKKKTQLHFLQEKFRFFPFLGIRVMLGVDATNIADHPLLKNETFNKIIFNFPHVGGKMRIDKNRELIRTFFVNVGQFLKADGLILMTLCDGQGGTLADRTQRRWDDSWKVKEMAAHGNFILDRVEPFDVSSFPNYHSTGYRGLEKKFHIQNSLTHFFRKTEAPVLKHLAADNAIDYDVPLNLEADIHYLDLVSKSNQDFCNLNPPIFQFNITFSIDTDFCEFQMFVVLHNFAGKIIRNVEFVRSYKFPSGKITNTYKISYQSDVVPLYRQRVIDIHRRIVAELLFVNLDVMVTR